MHKRHYLIALAGLVGSACVLSIGCIDALAEYYTPLTDPKLATWKDGGSGGSDGGGGTGGGKPDCSGDPSNESVVDDCGVFVQADAQAGGDGTQAKPLATLADALVEAQSSGKRVYACAGAAFSEAVTISAGVEVYGGFDCAAGWTWSPDARAVLNGPADVVALTITKAAEGAKVEGFTITAASPSDMKGGGSSIAIAVDDVAATIERCNVVANDAADGADGQTPSGLATKGTDAPAMGANGSPTDACVLPVAVSGGQPGVTSCDDGMTSGGNGGGGGITAMPDGNGLDGDDGMPTGNTNHGSGANGANECSDGTKGKSGNAGTAEPGGSALGDSLALSGIANADNTDGQAGTKAQGGGGGGGAKSGVFCKVGANTFDGPGASGGGGGGGGCGGKGGGGGRAGGSSIAILSLGTKLVLSEVTLAVGKAGKGGAGAAGQSGAAGGAGAVGGASSGIAPSVNGCKGGDGGAGGPGGPGSGGRGGHALGVAYAKTPSMALAVKTFSGGTVGGDGGDPGAGGGNSGEPGKSGLCWDFEKHVECGK